MQFLMVMFSVLALKWIISKWNADKPLDEWVDWNSPSKPEQYTKFSNKVQTRKIDEDMDY